MLETNLDVFFIISLISALLLLTASVARLAVVGGFSGLLFVMAGIYGVTSDISPLSGDIAWGVSIIIAIFGVMIMIQAYLSWR